MCAWIVAYFGCIDHCRCIGLRIVATSSSARLVTSDQLHKHRYSQINNEAYSGSGRTINEKKNVGKFTQISDIQKSPLPSPRRKLVLLSNKQRTTNQPNYADLISKYNIT